MFCHKLNDEIEKITNNPETIELDKNIENFESKKNAIDEEIKEIENQNQKFTKKIKIIHVNHLLFFKIVDYL